MTSSTRDQQKATDRNIVTIYNFSKITKSKRVSYRHLKSMVKKNYEDGVALQVIHKRASAYVKTGGLPPFDFADFAVLLVSMWEAEEVISATRLRNMKIANERRRLLDEVISAAHVKSQKNPAYPPPEKELTELRELQDRCPGNPSTEYTAQHLQRFIAAWRLGGSVQQCHDATTHLAHEAIPQASVLNKCLHRKTRTYYDRIQETEALKEYAGNVYEKVKAGGGIESNIGQGVNTVKLDTDSVIPSTPKQVDVLRAAIDEKAKLEERVAELETENKQLVEALQTIHRTVRKMLDRIKLLRFNSSKGANAYVLFFGDFVANDRLRLSRLFPTFFNLLMYPEKLAESRRTEEAAKLEGKEKDAEEVRDEKEYRNRHLFALFDNSPLAAAEKNLGLETDAEHDSMQKIAAASSERELFRRRSLIPDEGPYDTEKRVGVKTLNYGPLADSLRLAATHRQKGEEILESARKEYNDALKRAEIMKKRASVITAQVDLEVVEAGMEGDLNEFGVDDQIKKQEATPLNTVNAAPKPVGRPRKPKLKAATLEEGMEEGNDSGRPAPPGTMLKEEDAKAKEALIAQESSLSMKDRMALIKQRRKAGK